MEKGWLTTAQGMAILKSKPKKVLGNPASRAGMVFDHIVM
jgi:hypothetical protein